MEIVKHNIITGEIMMYNNWGGIMYHDYTKHMLRIYQGFQGKDA